MSEVLAAANELSRALDPDAAREHTRDRAREQGNPSQSLTVASALRAWLERYGTTLVLCMLYFGIGCAYYVPTLGWSGVDVCHCFYNLVPVYIHLRLRLTSAASRAGRSSTF